MKSQRKLSNNGDKKTAADPSSGTSKWHIKNFDKKVENLLKEEGCLLSIGRKNHEIQLRFFLNKGESTCSSFYKFKKFEYLGVMAQLLSPRSSALKFHVSIKGGPSSCDGDFTIGHSDPTVIIPQFFYLGISKYTENFERLIKTDAATRPSEVRLEICVTRQRSHPKMQLPLPPGAAGSSDRKNMAADELLCHDLEKMLKITDNFTDVTLVGKNKTTITAHRFILAARIPYFAKLFKDVKEEALNGTVQLEFASKEALNVLLHWVYTGKVLEEMGDFVAEIIPLAVKFEMEDFVQITDETLIKFCTRKNMFQLYQLAEQHKMKKALADLAHFIKNNVEVGLASET